MATIQWFPGHMSKARRQVQENLKHVDFVTILVDARLPLSSQNPMLTKIVGDKPKLLRVKGLKPWPSIPRNNLQLNW